MDQEEHPLARDSRLGDTHESKTHLLRLEVNVIRWQYVLCLVQCSCSWRPDNHLAEQLAMPNNYHSLILETNLDKDDNQAQEAPGLHQVVMSLVEAGDLLCNHNDNQNMMEKMSNDFPFGINTTTTNEKHQRNFG